MTETYNTKKGSKMEVTASESDKTREERLIHLCNRDIRRAVEEGRFVVETPTRSVEQSDLEGIAVKLRHPSEIMYCGGRPETVVGPPLLGLEFSLPLDYDGVTNDLADFETATVVYGDLHVWRLTDVWQSEVTHEGYAVGEKIYHSHKHEWGTVEEIDWRTSV